MEGQGVWSSLKKVLMLSAEVLSERHNKLHAWSGRTGQCSACADWHRLDVLYKNGIGFSSYQTCPDWLLFFGTYLKGQISAVQQSKTSITSSLECWLYHLFERYQGPQEVSRGLYTRHIALRNRTKQIQGLLLMYNGYSVLNIQCLAKIFALGSHGANSMNL
ncbi:hypothetical protein L7F22_028940 [Adiantum nelumboides]|nr:hypothetical protein [Adiantum nelumboides]